MRVAIWSVTLLAMTVGSAFASEVFIPQLSGRANSVGQAASSAKATQAGILAFPLQPSLVSLSVAPAASATTNASSLLQAGANNAASVTQIGGGNASAIIQRGNGNQASVTQRR